MSATPTTFTVGDLSFIVERLKPKQALRGLKLLNGGEAMSELLDLFAPVTKCTSDGSQGSPLLRNPTAIASMVDDIFTGHVDWLIAYVAGCSRGEYGAFLVGDGLKDLQETLGGGKPSSSPST